MKPNKSDKQAAELVEAKSEILRLRAQMRRIEEERLLAQILASYQGSSGVYGAPRVLLDLREAVDPHPEQTPA